jgi:FkbM family methyltransferase
VRGILNPFYEKEFKQLHKLTGREWNPSLILDVGGNLGQSSMAMDRLFKSDQLIIFEPNPTMAYQCKRLRFKNLKEFHVHQLGLGSKQSHLKLYTPSYKGVIFYGLASLSETQAIALFNSNSVWNFDSKKLEVICIEIELRSLDSFKLLPSFMKIDVEGFELEVLDGALETIKISKPLILIECTESHEKVRERLIPLGYKNYELDSHSWVSSRSIELNQVFIHESQLVS